METIERIDLYNKNETAEVRTNKMFNAIQKLRCDVKCCNNIFDGDTIAVAKALYQELLEKVNEKSKWRFEK